MFAQTITIKTKTMTHTINFEGTEITVSGYYEAGHAGNYFMAPEPQYFEAESIFIEDTDVTELFVNYGIISRVEDKIMEEIYL